MFEEVGPGESFRGYSYEDLVAMGDGEHELPKRTVDKNTNSE